MMHTAPHEDMLPDHVPPMPMPDNRKEARLLLLCLELGYMPTYEREDEKGLGLTETEIMARGG
jgi:hypothetical protein